MAFIYYGLCLFISFIMLLLVIASGSEHSIHQSLLICVMTIANGGYLALSLSKNIGEAILANKVIYVGGAFMPMLFFLIICEVCSVSFPRWLNLIMYGGQLITYVTICTIGYSDLYYKNVELLVDGGVGYLVDKVYGPAHFLYPFTMFGYLLAGTVVLIYSLRRRNKVSIKNTLMLIGGMAIASMAFVLERTLGLRTEIMPAVYVSISMSLTVIIFRAKIYLVDGSMDRRLSRFSKVGCITLSRKLNFMGCNEYAVSVFPELKEYYLDYPMPQDGSFLCDRIMLKLRMILEGGDVRNVESTVVEIEDRYLEYSVKPILSDGGIWYGYILVFSDVTDHQRYLKMIEGYSKNLESEVKGKTQRIRQIQEKTLLGMAQMVESRDLSTGGHVKRTSSVVAVFSKALLSANMGFSQGFLRYVERSAPMHDLGKITVDDKILRKQGKFTPEEYEIMKTHSAEGAKIVARILTGIEDEEFVRIATNVAHYHHEKVNGKGYPEGLKGDQIPIEARIMALADVFDALVSKRCYKEAFSYEKAFEIIREDAGIHFDERLAEVFLTCRQELEALYQSYEEEEEEMTAAATANT